MVIDAKMSEESAKQMLAEVAKITVLPVRVLVFTHSDGDHVNGIAGFPRDITIWAQEETKRYMDEAFTDARQRAYLPLIKTFATGDLNTTWATLRSNSSTLDRPIRAATPSSSAPRRRCLSGGPLLLRAGPAYPSP